MKTYKERTDYQLKEWVKGNSIHNDVDEECCPDFSCCNKDVNTPLEKRKQFQLLCEKADEEGFNEKHHPWYDAKMEMLMSFLGSSLSTIGCDVVTSLD